MGVLGDGAELLAALVLGEAGVGTERGDLLLLGGEDGFNLGDLVVGQAEALAHALRGLLGIEGVLAAMETVAGMLLVLLRGGGIVVRGLLGGLLAEGGRSGESNGQSGREKNAFHHVNLLLMAAAALPDATDGINTNGAECCGFFMGGMDAVDFSVRCGGGVVRTKY